MLFLATILQKDAFPFSYYGMFSFMHRLEHICVIRIALELENGDIVWWQPKEFYRYPEFVAIRLKKIYQEKDEEKQATQKTKIMREVVRLIALERVEQTPYRAFHIVECRVPHDFTTDNTTIDIIPLNSLKSDVFS